MIPDGFDDITPAWLTEVLRTAGVLRAAQITAIDRADAAGGLGVTGLVRRLRITLDRPEPGAPTSVFAKVRNPSYEGSPEHYAREVAFYQELSLEVASPAPRCYHAAYGAGRVVLILEDLTEVTPGHRLDGFNLSEARAVVEVMAKWHGHWWESARLRARAWPLLAYGSERIQGLVERYRTAWPRYREQDNWPLNPALIASGDALASQLTGALSRLESGPRTLIHCDAHVENILLWDHGDAIDVFVVDWQEAALGHCAFDLAYLIAGNTRPDIQRAHTGALIARYHDHLDVPGYSRAALRADYDAAVQWLFAIEVAWLIDFEPPTPHDRRTLEQEWARVTTAIVGGPADRSPGREERN